jgi:CheY-like chemotaxis protein
MKLLVVDDERSIVNYMHKLLTGWGHQVVSLCVDGELTLAAVLKQVKLQKFDVALVDNFKMPPLRGTDLPARIKRLSPATKIIIVTTMPKAPMEGISLLSQRIVPLSLSLCRRLMS